MKDAGELFHHGYSGSAVREAIHELLLHPPKASRTDKDAQTDSTVLINIKRLRKDFPWLNVDAYLQQFYVLTSSLLMQRIIESAHPDLQQRAIPQLKYRASQFFEPPKNATGASLYVVEFNAQFYGRVVMSAAIGALVGSQYDTYVATPPKKRDEAVQDLSITGFSSPAKSPEDLRERCIQMFGPGQDGILKSLATHHAFEGKNECPAQPLNAEILTTFARELQGEYGDLFLAQITKTPSRRFPLGLFQ